LPGFEGRFCNYAPSVLKESIFTRDGERDGRVKVRLCFLGGEGVDVGFHEHVCEDKVFENLNALETSCLVVIPEGLEKVILRSLKFICR